MLEFIGEILLTWLLYYPGAFFRWLFNGAKKGKLKVYMEDTNMSINAAIALGVVVTVFVFIQGVRYLVNDYL